MLQKALREGAKTRRFSGPQLSRRLAETNATIEPRKGAVDVEAPSNLLGGDKSSVESRDDEMLPFSSTSLPLVVFLLPTPRSAVAKETNRGDGAKFLTRAQII
jgi:hypothetical protein